MVNFVLIVVVVVVSEAADVKKGGTCGGFDARIVQKHLEKCGALGPMRPLKAIMLGTARSRDRMDERERARAQKKLEGLSTTAKGSRK